MCASLGPIVASFLAYAGHTASRRRNAIRAVAFLILRRKVPASSCMCSPALPMRVIKAVDSAISAILPAISTSGKTALKLTLPAFGSMISLFRASMVASVITPGCPPAVACDSAANVAVMPIWAAAYLTQEGRRGGGERVVSKERRGTWYWPSCSSPLYPQQNTSTLVSTSRTLHRTSATTIPTLTVNITHIASTAAYPDLTYPTTHLHHYYISSPPPAPPISLILPTHTPI